MYVCGQPLLVVVFYGPPLLCEFRVVDHRFQAAQLFEVMNPAVSQPRGEQAGQTADC